MLEDCKVLHGTQYGNGMRANQVCTAVCCILLELYILLEYAGVYIENGIWYGTESVYTNVRGNESHLCVELAPLLLFVAVLIGASGRVVVEHAPLVEPSGDNLHVINRVVSCGT